MKPDESSESLGRLLERVGLVREAIDVLDGRVVELRARVMHVSEQVEDLRTAITERVDLLEEKLVGIEMDSEAAGPRLRDIEREVKWIRNLLVPPTQ